ncbi:MAG: Hsp70 family protein [Kineosporiaceae bacterium]|nr:Hsp70 family protein [Kineosporiaceae bacterium]
MTSSKERAVPYHLGVDIGTTSTAAAICSGGPSEALPLGSRGAAVPTVVLVRPDGTVLVGETAERRAHEHPDRVAREFKRRVGDSVPLLLGGSPYPAPRLMAMVLQWVLERTVELRGAPPDEVIVSHPANWSRFKTEALVGAFAAAGLPVVTLITEPQAAALHFAGTERIDVGEIVAVYDLGGGTFDAAVLRRTEAGFEPVGAPEGIENLGGMDFDEAVLGHLRGALGERTSALETADASSLLALRRAAIEAKEGLSDDVDAVIPVRLPGTSLDVVLRRGEFEEMIRPSLELTVDCLERTVARADVAAADLAAVVLAGGSSRIPLVRELVGSRLGRPVVLDHQPQLAVALGAALVGQAPVGAAGAADTAALVGASGAAVGASEVPVTAPEIMPMTPPPVGAMTTVIPSGDRFSSLGPAEDAPARRTLPVVSGRVITAASVVGLLALGTGLWFAFGREDITETLPISTALPSGSLPTNGPLQTLTLTVPATGGWVGTSDGLIACGGGRTRCAARFITGAVAALQAHPDAGSSTVWGGACAGTAAGAECRAAVVAGTKVTVTFVGGTTAPTRNNGNGVGPNRIPPTSRDASRPPTTIITTSKSVAARPGAVTSMSLSHPSSTTLDLAWGAAPGATSYRLGWTESGSDGRTWTSDDTEYGADRRGVTLISLRPGRTYTVTVTPLNAVGAGPTSQRAMDTLAAASPPSAVSSMSLSDPTTTTLALHWGAANGATSYRLAWTENGADGRTWRSSDTEYGASRRGVTLIGLRPGRTYSVSVTPLNASGSGPTTTRSATTRSVPTGSGSTRSVPTNS